MRQPRLRVHERRSFADFVGSLPPDAEALLKPTVTPSSGAMDEISAGAGVGYFSLVWNIGGGLSESIVGGPSTLTEGLAAAQRVELGAKVHGIVHNFRTVAIGPGLVGTLRGLLAVRAEHDRDDAGWLFLCRALRAGAIPADRSRSATPPHRHDWHEQALDGAGVADLPLHGLRHTAAAWLGNDRSLEFVRAQLGTARSK